MSPIELIKADLYRYTGAVNTKIILKNLLNNNRSFKYTFWLRLCKSKNFLIRCIAWYIHRHLSIKYAIQISKECDIGPGLYLGHSTSIIVSKSAKIGSNCNLSQFTTIGSNHGKAANIGDNVYIGPNVCLVENINIGNNATIGAGSVVLKNVPENTTFAGNPAKFISEKLPARYITNPINLR